MYDFRPLMRYGFVIDQDRCIGCHACTVACKEAMKSNGDRGEEKAGIVVHEGTHGIDRVNRGGRLPKNKAEEYSTELNAAHNEAYVAKGLDFTNEWKTWQKAWGYENNVDMEAQIENEATASTNLWCQNGGNCKK